MEKYYMDVCPTSGSGGKAWIALIVFSDSAQHIMATISRGRVSGPNQLPLLDE